MLLAGKNFFPGLTDSRSAIPSQLSCSFTLSSQTDRHASLLGFHHVRMRMRAHMHALWRDSDPGSELQQMALRPGNRKLKISASSAAYLFRN